MRSSFCSGLAPPRQVGMARRWANSPAASAVSPESSSTSNPSARRAVTVAAASSRIRSWSERSEEHTSELQSRCPTRCCSDLDDFLAGCLTFTDALEFLLGARTASPGRNGEALGQLAGCFRGITREQLHFQSQRPESRYGGGGIFAYTVLEREIGRAHV